MIEKNFYMAAVFFMQSIRKKLPVAGSVDVKASKRSFRGRFCRCQSKQEKLSVTGSLCFRKELKQYA